MRLLGKGDEGELVVLEVAFLSYSGDEPVEYKDSHAAAAEKSTDIYTTKKSTGLYIWDTTGSGWIVPGMSRTVCDLVAEKLFRDGRVSLMEFGTDHIYIRKNNRKGIKMGDFNKGAAYARDLIIANIIGLQNEARYHQGTEGYNALQELLEHCTETYGGMCQPFKG